MKRDATGEQGYRLGPGSSEIANVQAFEGSSASEARTIATPEAMQARKLATPKGARRPAGSPRPGAFSSVDQIGNPFAPQVNGTGQPNGVNGTSPFPSFTQSQPASQSANTPSFSFGGNSQSSIFSNTSSNTNQGGNTFNFNSLGQPHADQKQNTQPQSGGSSAFNFTFGGGGSSSGSAKPSGSTFNFGGTVSNNPFAGMSQQQSSASSGGLFSTAKPVANSFPPNQPSTFTGFGNASSNNEQQQNNVFGKSAGSFDSSNTNGQSSLFSGFGTNASSQSSGQPAGGLFQQPSSTSNSNPFQQSQTQSNGLFQQPQSQSSNIFGQSQQQSLNQNFSEAKASNSTDDDMQTSPPNSPPKATPGQRSIFDVMSNGEKPSQSSDANPFAYLSQHSSQPSQPSLFASAQSQTTSSSQQQTLPAFAGFGQNQLQKSTSNSSAAPESSQTSIHNSTGFAQSTTSPDKSTSTDTTEQSKPESAEKPGIAPPKFSAPTFGSGPFENPFGKTASSANAQQAAGIPKFDAPSFKTGPFSNPFGNSTAKSSSPSKPDAPTRTSGLFSSPSKDQATPVASSPEKSVAPSQSSFFPQLKPSSEQSGSTAPTSIFSKESTTPVGSPSKPASTTQSGPLFQFGTPTPGSKGTSGTWNNERSSDASQQSIFSQSKSFGNAGTSKDDSSAGNGMTEEQRQVYEAQRNLRALNHGFKRALAATDNSDDLSDMMHAYLSAVEKVKTGYTQGAKRKQQGEPTETPKRARPNEDPAATPDTQQRSTTANLFQSIVSKDATPTKPASPLFFSQPKTPTREPEGRGLFQNNAGDAPATEPHNQNAGKSLFDRVSPSEQPATEVKKPTFSFFPPTPGSNEKTSPGDHTWKNDSPIKFSAPQPQSNPSQFLFPGSTPGSTTTSRATSPGAGDGGTTSEAESTTSNTEEADKTNDEQVDLTAVDPNSEVLYEAEKARGSIQDLESKKWEVRGTGPLRILKNKESGVISVLLRTIPSGRVVFNSRLIKGLPYKSVGKSAVTMPVVAAEGKPQTWYVRFQSQGLADEFVQACEKWKDTTSS